MASTDIISDRARELANEARTLLEKADSLASEAKVLSENYVDSLYSANHELMIMATLFGVAIFVGHLIVRTAKGLSSRLLVLPLSGFLSVVAVAGITVFAEESFAFSRIMAGIGIGLAALAFTALYVQQVRQPAALTPSETSDPQGDAS